MCVCVCVCVCGCVCVCVWVCLCLCVCGCVRAEVYNSPTPIPDDGGSDECLQDTLKVAIPVAVSTILVVLVIVACGVCCCWKLKITSDQKMRYLFPLSVWLLCC